MSGWAGRWVGGEVGVSEGGGGDGGGGGGGVEGDTRIFQKI